jgi:hypothetical protein
MATTRSRDHRVAVDSLDSRCLHLDVRPGERRVVRVREDRALTAKAIVGRQLRAQLGIPDLPTQVSAPERLNRANQLGPAAEAQADGLVQREDQIALDVLRLGKQLVQPALDRRNRPVGMWNDPRRRALEYDQPIDARLDHGHELRGRGPGADHADAFAAQIVCVIPARRVKAMTGE